MPVTTGFVDTADDYPASMEAGGAIVGPFQTLATVQFTVSGATVAAIVAKKRNQDNSLHWDSFETTFAPGENGYSGEVYGLKLRSYVPGSPAVVAINAYFEDDPIPFSNPQPLDGTISPSGGFTPLAGGIQFDVTPQVGTFLDLTTTGNDGFDGMNFTAADRIHMHSTGGDVLIGADAGALDLSAGGAGSFFAHDLTIEATTTDIIEQAQRNWQTTAVTGTAEIQGQTGAGLTAIAGDVDLTAGGTGNIHLKRGTVGSSALLDMTAANIQIKTNSGKIIEADESVAATRKLGFFGVGPVAKQATPVTLADVIALLQAYGLSA